MMKKAEAESGSSLNGWMTVNEREKKPNRYISHVMMVVFFDILIVDLLNAMGLFYITEVPLRVASVVSLVLAFLAIGFGMNKRTCDKAFSKYVIMGLVLLDVLCVCVVLNQYTVLVLLMPLFLSVLYHEIVISVVALVGSMLIAIISTPLSYVTGCFQADYTTFLLNAANLNVELTVPYANYEFWPFIGRLVFFIGLPECMIIFAASIMVFSSVKQGRDEEAFRVQSSERIASLEKDFTGSYVRRAFYVQAEELIKNNPEKEYDLYLADLHNFTGISRMYGPAVSEEVLKKTAAALRTGCPEALVGRYGIDQFSLLIEKKEDVEGVLAPLEKEIKKITDPRIRMNYGICRNIEKQQTLAIGCRQATMALSTIKRHYEKYYAIYDTKLDEKYEKRRDIEDSMLESLENDRFVVYFQPKHGARTGNVIGAEALVRWQHPKYGLLFPNDFIPIFEESGFLPRLDIYVIDKVCALIRQWIDRGENPVPVSINWSRAAFSSFDCCEEFLKALKKYDLPAGLLHLEVTESAFVENPQRMKEQLAECKAAGICIELDDFGSGYSSLSSLSQMSLDVIKIDRSLVLGIHTEDGLRLLKTSIQLANSFGYRTLCEGVETEEDLQICREAGTDLIQGYFYAKPLPVPQFEEYLLEHKR